MSERKLVTAQSLEKAPRGSSATRDLVASMIQSEATVVFGPKLMRRVEDQLIDVGRVHLAFPLENGYQALRQKYVPTTISIMRGMDWNEGDPETRLYSSAIYERSLAIRINDGEDAAVDHEAVIAARDIFAQDHHTNPEIPTLFVSLFNFSSDDRIRKTLVTNLRLPGKRENVYKRLRDLK